jgi:hypothetical protein
LDVLLLNLLLSLLLNLLLKLLLVDPKRASPHRMRVF